MYSVCFLSVCRIMRKLLDDFPKILWKVTYGPWKKLTDFALVIRRTVLHDLSVLSIRKTMSVMWSDETVGLRTKPV